MAMTVPGIKWRKQKAGLTGNIPDAVPFPVPGGALYVGGAMGLLGQAKAYKWKILGNAGIMDGYQTLVHSA